MEITQYKDKADGTLMAVIKIITGIRYVIEVVIPFCSGCDFIANQELANVKIAARIGKT